MRCVVDSKMRVGRTVTLMLSLGLLIALMAPGASPAQAWPQKPVRILIGFAPAGTPDVATRVVAPKLAEALGQAVIVENRAGAGGVIAMEAAAKAPPDGYTLGLATVGTMLLAKALIPTAGYDPITSFIPVGSFAGITFIVAVSSSLQVKTVQEFVDYAKARPGKLNYGASTPGSPPHMFAEMFKSQAGVNIVGINYKGSADAAARLIAGDVQMMVDAWPTIGPMIAPGKVTPLLVTSSVRTRKLPEVPTATEAGMPDYTAESWLGLVAPIGTDETIVRRISDELQKIMATKDMADAMDRLGVDVFSRTSEQFAAIIRRDWPKWSAAVKAAGIKP